MVTYARTLSGGGRLTACIGSLAVLVACGTEYAQTAEVPPAGDTAGTAGTGPSCPSALDDRLSVTTFGTEADIRYKHQGYDWFPTDERIALSLAPSGELKVAWLENAGTNVHVTPLSAQGERTGPDVVVRGFDVGGLVAQDDGFMLLTRREDPGEPLADPAADFEIATAGLLVRVRGESEAFAVALTGTATIIEDTPPDRRRDCASVWLNGRLAFNGERYGAYFQVHGCEGNWNASYYGDKLVYADDDGRAFSGGWDWKCSINQGIRLLPETGSFTSLCLSDREPNPGLNLVTEETSRQLADEMTTVGFCAGQFGSVVKMSDGSYVVGWLSRGVNEVGGQRQAAKEATDVAIIRLGPDRTPVGPLTWLPETPNIAETNLHLAAYGRERLLVVWDSIEGLDCSAEPCFGRYTGTHARLIDLEGNFLTPDRTIPAPPSANDDLVTLPNGDLAWAFVPDPQRDYRSELYLDASGVPIAPARREISVARLRYCP